ncbi:hypothetical protein DFQ28_000043 [Apophysomyces sp. BC1034]|nr:hypothetical protein DFQ30_007801 [Apophysomyces sp. BC1015]KAG0182847.1 hypothetical protein DFQ29_001787 [Apophysomyces sp. BC1021]KAG0194944.1 hypothetical protein DFQ28_000043 [Apophysomyces sp. BC1034]
MTQSPRLQNLYVAKLTAQERPCFVCSKFTSVVLTSADNSNSDWFYVCRSHLGDCNFCSQLGQSKSPQAKRTQKSQQDMLQGQKVESDSVSDLVASIGSAWKSWRGKTETDEKEKKEEEEKKDNKQEKKEETTVAKKEKEEEQQTSAGTIEPSSPRPQQQVRFVLQRDYFYLRQREQTKKLQKKHATEKLKSIQFPEVPKGLPVRK